MICGDKYKRVTCVLLKGHEGDHQAEFPKYHNHVDENGNITPDIEQPFTWSRK